MIKFTFLGFEYQTNEDASRVEALGANGSVTRTGSARVRDAALLALSVEAARKLGMPKLANFRARKLRELK